MGQEISAPFHFDSTQAHTRPAAARCPCLVCVIAQHFDGDRPLHCHACSLWQVLWEVLIAQQPDIALPDCICQPEGCDNDKKVRGMQGCC